ncbi:MAG TPA: PfkB family carbohydrate kinase [Methylomirabilota bacterium]|jgi:sugar/nucleoside kinase (ribokinase family)|nr:PfkB family carbohydrate kinase [Methylomirabilota bacterium]
MPVDFVAVGHVTLDQTPTGTRPGGAAYYSVLTAHRLGLRVGLVTSFGPDFPVDALPVDVVVVNVPSALTTVFSLEGSGPRRKLTLMSRAADIETHHVPADWRGIPLGMLCPVINEVDPALAGDFVEASLGVAPQGWMRQRGAGGAIAPRPWEDADLVLPHAQLLVVSLEDIEPFQEMALEWFQHLPLAAVTRGPQGAILFVNGERYHVEPDRAAEVDDTGAGDVFATALLIEYQREGNPWEAAAVAACAAAAAVEGVGVTAIPDRATLTARLAAYHRRLGA